MTPGASSGGCVRLRAGHASLDAALIDEAEGLLFSASRIGAPGRFQLEAAVQSAHAARRLGGWTNSAAIVQVYDALLALPPVVVAINRAVALAAPLGASAAPPKGWRRSTPSTATRLAEYQPYWAAAPCCSPGPAARERPPTCRAPSGSNPIRRCAGSSRPSCRGPDGPPPACRRGARGVAGASARGAGRRRPPQAEGRPRVAELSLPNGRIPQVAGLQRAGAEAAISQERLSRPLSTWRSGGGSVPGTRRVP